MNPQEHSSQEMQDVLAQAQHACDLLDALGPISHDLHNVFNGMVLQVALAVRGLEEVDKEKVQVLRSLALQASQKLAQIDQARRGIKSPQVTVDVNEVIEASLRSFQASGIPIQHQPTPGLPVVQGNVWDLRRLIEQLLRCSRDAMLAQSCSGSMIVKTEQLGETVLARVQDPVPVGDQDLVLAFFDPFNPARLGENPLDRAASQSLAKKLGANLRVEASAEGGTHVIVEFPQLAGLRASRQ